MHIAVVFNPQAGPRTASSVLQTVTDSLDAQGHSIAVFDRVSQPNFETAMRTQADDFDRVVVIGGDGTLNGVINGIAASGQPDLPVAFVPTGRGKDTARTLPSFLPDTFAATSLVEARIQPVDLIRITMADGSSRLGVNISDIGIGAHAAVVANGLPRILGALSYVLGAVRSMLPLRPFPLLIRINDEPINEENALLLSICNGRAFGGGIYVSPTSNASDGLLEVVVVRNANLLDLATQLPRLKAGTLHNHRAISRRQATRIDVEPVDCSWYEVDGERLNAQPIRYEIVPAALNWICPT